MDRILIAAFVSSIATALWLFVVYSIAHGIAFMGIKFPTADVMIVTGVAFFAVMFVRSYRQMKGGVND